MAHAYTYVSRWMKEKKVRRVKDGYEKVKGNLQWRTKWSFK